MQRKMAGVTEAALVLGGWRGKAMGREAGPSSILAEREAFSRTKARVGHTAAGWTEYTHGHHTVGTSHRDRGANGLQD